MKDCVLVLNAAEARVQFALARVVDGFDRAVEHPVELLCTQQWSAPSRGTEILPAALEQTFRLLDLTPASSLGRIACVCGPGSFTGIRLALTLGAALHRTTGAPLCGANYLHVLAASAPLEDEEREGRFVRVLTHARRNLVHMQDFWQAPSSADRWPEPCGEPRMVELAHVPDGLSGMLAKAPVRLVGSGLTRNAEVLLPLVPKGCRGVPGQTDHPAIRVLLQAALRAPAQQNDLDPLYLRPCDAVDNLAHIAEDRGQKPEEAEARLSALLERRPDAAAL